MTFLPKPLKGRGAVTQPKGRFESTSVEPFDDEWGSLEDTVTESIETQLFAEKSRSIITHNDSPDVGFDRSINPYRGCAHGCVYCYARPAHSYMNLSPGLDFETKLFYKPDAARLLREELRKPGYECRLIHVGGNTDPYQPIERDVGITRQVLEVLLEFQHPVSIITKGAALMRRDLDVFARLAEHNLVRVAVSVTSLKDELKRTLEPRTSNASLRLKLIRELAGLGIDVTVMAAPMIPFVNDMELESILEAAADAGAKSAGYVTLRLPWEVRDIFRAWLDAHLPARADHVMSLVEQMHGGRAYEAQWHVRQRGTGAYATLFAKRFEVACKRLGLNAPGRRAADATRFRVPPESGDQLALL
ncbi:MAG TPA: PA0069 family radical SAM protein [Nevskiaceae bacterium]|nr:PA0069 family radical SAM protein [Nevskiaceae bacterium]